MIQRFEKVPIYLESRDLLKMCHEVTNKFPKTYKFTLGGDIRKYILKLTETIFLNLNEIKRKEHFDTIELLCNQLTICFRICLDLNLVQQKDYIQVLSKIDSVAKHSKRWQNSKA